MRLSLSFMTARRWRILFVVLCAGLFFYTGLRVVRKAAKGRSAFVRWMADTERLLDGEMIYDTEEEGYPNLPMMALILRPFHLLGAIGGSIAWWALKCLIILWILYVTMRFCEYGGTRWPPWVPALFVVLSWRVFSGDITHANVNLIIGGLIITALWCEANERDGWAGFAIGLATVLKVTPALFLVYFLYKRRWRALVGAAAAGVLFTFVVPGVVLGFGRTWDLTWMWFRQMIVPFLEGTRVDEYLTGYPNQSIPGLFHRLLSHQPAIRAGRHGDEAIYVNIVSLSSERVGLLVRIASLAVLGALAAVCRTPRNARRHVGVLGEYALVFLAMLFLSERSWKHHYVLLILPHAFVLSYLVGDVARRGFRRIPEVFFGIALALQLLFGEMLVGEYLNDLSEAYGVYVVGGLCLFAACACILVRYRRAGWPGSAETDAPGEPPAAEPVGA